MSLRLRVFGGVAVLLLLLFGAAWFLGGVAIIQPLMTDLVDERVDRAVQIAVETEAAEEPKVRAKELMDEHNLTIRLTKPPPRKAIKMGRVKEIDRNGRSIFIMDGPHSPIIIEVETPRGQAYLEILYPADLVKHRRRSGIGLGLLALVGILLALAASRWMLRPLQLASKAMDRVASGDLAHRVPEGADSTGRMGQSFNAMADRLQRMVEGQQELMGGVSHELRTPLARLRLQTELLRDQDVDPARLDAIENDITEMDALVGELLEASRLREGSVALRLRSVELASVIERALEAENLGSRALEIRHEADCWVDLDDARMHRVFRNLFSNIRRYTSEDVPVRVSSGRAEAGVFVEVADGGPGVPDALLSQIFEPFFREEKSRSKATGGLGLGMMLVQRIIEAHGGTVEACRAPEGGLLVRIQGLSESSPSELNTGSDPESS